MDVEQLLNERKIPYQIQGSDCLVKCLNPEHDDSHPSMRIDRVRGIFNCLSCGFKGNIFKYFGTEVSKVDSKILELKEKILQMQVPSTVDFPVDMQLYNKDYRNISVNTLQKFEAFTTYEVEHMEDRIIFPIRNINGEVKAFIGRYIFSNATPKYRILPRKVSLPLFPAVPEVINNSVILVEGIFDAINLIDKGLTNAVCTFGTKTISDKSFNRLFKHYPILGINTVYTMFDADDAGKKATVEVAKQLSRAGFHTDNIQLEEGTDPGDLDSSDVSLLKELLYESSNSGKEHH